MNVEITENGRGSWNKEDRETVSAELNSSQMRVVTGKVIEDCHQEWERMIQVDSMSQGRARDFSGGRRNEDQKVVLGSKESWSSTSWHSLRHLAVGGDEKINNLRLKGVSRQPRFQLQQGWGKNILRDLRLWDLTHYRLGVLTLTKISLNLTC